MARAKTPARAAVADRIETTGAIMAYDEGHAITIRVLIPRSCDVTDAQVKAWADKITAWCHTTAEDTLARGPQ
jgi:hypothetical protein